MTDLERKIDELCDNGLPQDIEIDIRTHKQWLRAFADFAARLTLEAAAEAVSARDGYESVYCDAAAKSIRALLGPEGQ